MWFCFSLSILLFPSLHEEVLQQAGDEDGEAREGAHNQRCEALVAGDEPRPFAGLRGALFPRHAGLLAAQREQGRGAKWSAKLLARILATPARTNSETIVCVSLETGDLECSLLSLKNLRGEGGNAEF